MITDDKTGGNRKISTRKLCPVSFAWQFYLLKAEGRITIGYNMKKNYPIWE